MQNQRFQLVKTDGTVVEASRCWWLRRRAGCILAGAGELLLAWPVVFGADQVLVEDWSRRRSGTRVIPIDWRGQN